jgi:hypothetical protein
MDIIPLKGVVNVHLSREFTILSGRSTGGIVVHPIVEVYFFEGMGGGLALVLPAALVLEYKEKLSSVLIEEIEIFDGICQDNVV